MNAKLLSIQLNAAQHALVQALAHVNEATIYCLHNEQNGHYIGDERAVTVAVRNACELADDAVRHLQVARQLRIP